MSSRRFAEEIVMTTSDYEPRSNFECKKARDQICQKYMQPEFARQSEQIQFG
jgi:hypothetical protein